MLRHREAWNDFRDFARAQNRTVLEIGEADDSLAGGLRLPDRVLAQAPDIDLLGLIGRFGLAEGGREDRAAEKEGRAHASALSRAGWPAYAHNDFHEPLH